MIEKNLKSKMKKAQFKTGPFRETFTGGQKKSFLLELLHTHVRIICNGRAKMV